MIKFIAFAAFALALATSAQALPRVPLHQPDGISTKPVTGRCSRLRRYRRYGYGGYRRYGYSGYRHYGYGYRPYGYCGYRHYGYRPYGYRPYGYGVARGIARRNIRRGVLR